MQIRSITYKYLNWPSIRLKKILGIKALPEKMHGQKHSMLSFDQDFAQQFEELLLLPR